MEGSYIKDILRYLLLRQNTFLIILMKASRNEGLGANLHIFIQPHSVMIGISYNMIVNDCFHVSNGCERKEMRI